MDELKPFPVNRRSYERRIARFENLLRLKAPSPILARESYYVMVAAFGGHGPVLWYTFREWLYYLWNDYVDRPIALTRCRWWCWWNEKRPKDYWEFRQIERERECPVNERMPADEEERVN